MTEARRRKKQQEDPPTRRDMCSIMTGDYQKLKRNEEGYQRNLLLYQAGLCYHSSPQNEEDEKGNISLRLPEPQHHSACRRYSTHMHIGLHLSEGKEVLRTSSF